MTRKVDYHELVECASLYKASSVSYENIYPLPSIRGSQQKREALNRSERSTNYPV